MTESAVQSSCAADAVLQLPELQEPIIRFLNIDDLLQCVQVCRAWNLIFARQLWSSCDDMANPWQQIIRCASDSFGLKRYSCTEDRKEEARSLFSKFSPLIRHLSTKLAYTVHLFLDMHRGRLIPNGEENDRSDIRPRLESISLNIAKYRNDYIFEYSLRGNEGVHKTQEESGDREAPLKVVPPDIFTPKANDKGMASQMRTFWLLVLDHSASLRRLDFDLYEWQIRETPIIEPSIDLGLLLDSGVNMEVSKERLVIQKAISQSSTGTQFLIETLESIPRLEHLRPPIPEGYGLGTLAIFPHGRFNSLQSLDLREEIFSGDASPFFPKSSNQDIQIGRFRGLFRNTRIRSLRLRAVDDDYLVILVQDIFPSLEHLTIDTLGRNKIISSSSQLDVIENNALKTLSCRNELSIDRLSIVPIRWLALTTLQCRFSCMFLLDALLQKMPRIENVIHCRSGEPEIERNFEPDLNSNRVNNEHRQQPWHKSLRKFEGTFRNVCNSQKSALFDLLPCMTNIVCLSLGFIEVAIMKDILVAIPRPFLEELTLKLTHNCFNCSKYLAEILSSCPRLKVLKGEGLQIKARDVFRAPWPSTNLRELHFLIYGVPKLSTEQQRVLAYGPPTPVFSDGEPPQEGQIERKRLERAPSEGTRDWKKRLKKVDSWRYDVVVQHRQRCIDIQRKVLAVLARQEHLEFLDVGGSTSRFHGILDGMDPLPNTLELTLETGLDQLAALQGLRGFGIQNVDHRMKEQEADWIALHWPKFATLKGCRTQGHTRVHSHQGGPHESLPENDLEKSLRPFSERLKQLKPKVIFHGRVSPEN